MEVFKLATLMALVKFSCILGESIFRSLGEHGVAMKLEWDSRAINEIEGYYSLEASYYKNTKVTTLFKRAAHRAGHSTMTHSCGHVQGVPSSLRTASGIGPSGLSNFYQKYTEAYGIPVVASERVADDALKRACYVLRFMLADHSGVRESVYKLSGRVAVIGANEETTDIPEHHLLNSSYNARTRGLGATEQIPVSTAGEENLLCLLKDRYHPEDIYLHEVAHAVHLLGAKLAISGWDSRLQHAYNHSKFSGLWSSTYALSTYEEYFAEGAQSFFNCNDYAHPPNGIHNEINTHDKLRPYDPQLFNLISEVFPCGNTYLKRCESNRDKENAQVLKMNCDHTTGAAVVTTTTTLTNDHCVDQHQSCSSWSNEGECTKNPSYMLIYCKKSCDVCPTVICPDKHELCTSWAINGECFKNPGYMLDNCKKSCHVC